MFLRASRPIIAAVVPPVEPRSAVRASRTDPSMTEASAPSFGLEPLEPRLLLSGTNYIVDSLLDVVAADGLVTLREAINAANTNSAVTPDVVAGSATDTDTITFDQAALSAEAGLPLGSPLTITLAGTQLEITDALAITGLGPNLLTIDADGLSRVFLTSIKDQNKDASLTGLTITGGYAKDGGGIYSSFSTVTLTDCALYGNSAQGSGGAIEAYYGTLTVIDSIISDNSAPNSGGGIQSSFATTLINSTVAANSTLGYGGGVASLGGTLTVDGCSISDNVAGVSGGGIYNVRGTVTLVRTNILGNTAVHSGGGIANSGLMTLTQCIVSGNSATGSSTFGGGIASIHNTLTLNDTTVTGNVSVSAGGGVAGDGGTIALHNSLVALNQANTGADVYADSSVSLGSFIGTSDGDPGFVRNPSDGGDGWADDPSTLGIDESANNDYGDLRLRSDSPCIDAGDNTLLPADDFDLDGDGNVVEPLPIDLDGRPRVYGPQVDVGAYEFVPSVAGDFSGDGIVNVEDINPFILALTNPTAYAAQHLYADLLVLDPNGDGLINIEDINPFVDLLTGSGAGDSTGIGEPSVGEANVTLTAPVIAPSAPLPPRAGVRVTDGTQGPSIPDFDVFQALRSHDTLVGHESVRILAAPTSSRAWTAPHRTSVFTAFDVLRPDVRPSAAADGALGPAAWDVLLDMMPAPAAL